MRIYLSGGMEYAADEGRSWRDEMEVWLRKELAADIFNPNVESERFLQVHDPEANFRAWKHTQPEEFKQLVTKIVELDCREIAERSDLVICLWDAAAARGAGTKGELTMAQYFRKPVYLVTRIPFAEIPGWVIGCTTAIFPSFEALQNFLKEQQELLRV
jgi:hypothetical protein